MMVELYGKIGECILHHVIHTINSHQVTWLEDFLSAIFISGVHNVSCYLSLNVSIAALFISLVRQRVGIHSV